MKKYTLISCIILLTASVNVFASGKFKINSDYFANISPVDAEENSSEDEDFRKNLRSLKKSAYYDSMKPTHSLGITLNYFKASSIHDKTKTVKYTGMSQGIDYTLFFGNNYGLTFGYNTGKSNNNPSPVLDFQTLDIYYRYSHNPAKGHLSFIVGVGVSVTKSTIEPLFVDTANANKLSFQVVDSGLLVKTGCEYIFRNNWLIINATVQTIVPSKSSDYSVTDEYQYTDDSSTVNITSTSPVVFQLTLGWLF